MALRYSYKWEDRGWEKLRRKVTADPKTYVNVGILGSGADQEHGDSGITTLEVGILQEFGSLDGHTPQRSFLRRTLVWNNRREITAVLAQVTRMVLFQDYTRLQAMNYAGAWAVSKVRATIEAGVAPPNDPNTIYKKGHGLTLRDSLALIGALGYVVMGGYSKLAEEGEYQGPAGEES